ncbi:hypothetical protein [Labilibaculum euxinus]|uniref:hypothetical protein n=1 Tax=Labilibaculum euxinus TaxID=2686357 RepID=UPI001783CE83|nr:hypothetical protein [Labilibaculum euxinus]MDQ1772763.1 hypothetical protein [Labilibaculum euxinus]
MSLTILFNDDRNNKLLKEYQKLAKASYEKYIFGGRLADYKYYDMNDTIEAALLLEKKI